MRYDGKDLEGQLPQNVHCYSWLPQNDLIRKPLICGYLILVYLKLKIFYGLTTASVFRS